MTVTASRLHTHPNRLRNCSQDKRNSHHTSNYCRHYCIVYGAIDLEPGHLVIATCRGYLYCYSHCSVAHPWLEVDLWSKLLSIKVRAQLWVMIEKEEAKKMKRSSINLAVPTVCVCVCVCVCVGGGGDMHCGGCITQYHRVGS